MNGKHMKFKALYVSANNLICNTNAMNKSTCSSSPSPSNVHHLEIIEEEEEKKLIKSKTCLFASFDEMELPRSI